MDTLDAIAIRNQTDMATVFTRTYAKPHGYAPHLDKLFSPIREKWLKLVEIGVGGGESIKTWLDYFPKGKIFGVDIVKDTNPWNTVGHPHPRYKFHHADQSDSVFWKCFLADNGPFWDVLIDDGGHEASQIQATFVSMWPHIATGGLYVVEDLNYNWSRNLTWLGTLMDRINHSEWSIDSLYFSRELAVFTKR